jgi:cytochrome c biogenesis protein CcmG, thiol:disulfide interchange protein DsbE
VVVAVGVIAFANVMRSGVAHASIGDTAPEIGGLTLDGAPFRLSELRGQPVVLNFWGPSCVPCREEFPLLERKQASYAADGLRIVGVLTDDPPDPARDFVAEYGATWPTVIDPDKAAKAAYRVVGRPQTYFVDRSGVIRSIQVGELTDADFDRQYAKIAQ